MLKLFAIVTKFCRKKLKGNVAKILQITQIDKYLENLLKYRQNKLCTSKNVKC